MSHKLLSTVLIAVAAITVGAQEKTVLYQTNPTPTKTITPAVSFRTPDSPSGFRHFGACLVHTVEYPSADFDLHGVRLTLIASDHHNLYGADFGIIYNYLRGDLEGGQFTFIWNQVDNNVMGAQDSFVGNYVGKTLKGAQLAFGVNISQGIGLEKNIGAQVAAVNIANDLKGAQVGLINKVSNMKGCQIGLVNYAESMEGCQIGLANILGNGKLPFMVIFNCNF